MNTNTKSHTPKCSVCSSDLIFVSKKTDELEGYQFSQTTTIYRCSNIACQEEKDKQAEKRIKARQEKMLIDQKRAEQRSLAKAEAPTKRA